jgi:hypothetical protein
MDNMNNMARCILVGISGAFMAATLTSCQIPHPHSGHETIVLSEGVVAVEQGKHVTLSVPEYIYDQQLSRPSPYKFQWYRNGDLIPGATRYRYDLDPVQYTDATQFYCMIYDDGLAETNLTVELSLSVSPSLGKHGLIDGVEAPTTGPLQSGPPSSPVAATNSCIPKCNDYAQFKSAANNSYWWGPAKDNVNCTAVDTSGNILKPLPRGYDAKLVVLEAARNTQTGQWTYANYCSTNEGSNSSVTFPITQGNCYQFILCVMAPSPPAIKIGQPLEVTFTGGW